MKKRLTMLLCASILAVFSALAQTKVTGTIIQAEDGEPVIGAHVVSQSAGLSTVSDANGRFEINVKVGTPLEISHVGNERVTVRAKQNMHIEMHSVKELDEVMVVAYGTAKKSAFTGSAAVLKNEEIQKTANSNPVDALRGKVTGVQVNSRTGQPGQESFSILIRGISSINAGTAPLIILDGAPFSGDLNTIANSDIESMTVLKDAASAALYGARGANGVIIITTKNATRGKTTLTVDAKWGSNSRAIPDYKYLNNPGKYYEMWYQSLRNYAGNKLGQSETDAHRWANDNLTQSSSYGLGYNVFSVPTGESLIGMNGKLNPNAKLGNVVTGTDGKQYLLTPDDWTDAIYQNGLRQEYTLTAASANQNGSFYASANWLKNEGITAKSDYERFSGRLKADYQIKPWLKIAGNFNYAHYDSNYLGNDGNAISSGNVNAIRTVAPIYPIYLRNADGSYIISPLTLDRTYDYGAGEETGAVRPAFTNANPLQALILDTRNIEGNSLNATGSAEIRFLKHFKFTSVNTVVLDEARETTVQNGYFGQFKTDNGNVAKGHTRTWNYNFHQLLNWQRFFGQHDVEVMLGHEYYRAQSYDLSALRKNIFSLDNGELDGAIIDGSMGSSRSMYNVEGWFARAQYNFATKYFVSGSFRRDGSSRFSPKKPWGTFYSAGAGWLMNKEKWFKKLNAEWVDELKLKASYGEQGNDRISNYLYTDRFSIENSDNKISLIGSKTKGNSKIAWEKNGNFNAGLEFSLWHGRLRGSIDGFYRKTSDMLAFVSLPPSYGYNGYWDNIGDMVNKGVEIELNGDIIRSRGLVWSANANFTYYKNKVTYLAEPRKTMEVDGYKGYQSDGYFYGENLPLYTWYMHRYAGVDPNTGEALYYKHVVDSDGNPTGEMTTTTNASNASDFLCGTALPKAYGGFGTSLSYRGFDFAIDFAYQLGGKVYDSSYAAAMGSSNRGKQMHADLQNAWTPENRNTDIPRMQYNDQYTTATSDRFLTSASYLSLQNINLGYNLPKAPLKKLHIEGVRLYLSAANVWLWSKRQGLDPRQSITGATTNAYYSPVRTISGGITVNL